MKKEAEILVAVQKIIPDEDVFKAFENTNFGDTSKREVIADTVLKLACGYRSGHTAESITIELGLVNSKTKTLSVKGKAYLWAVYGY